MTTQDDLLGQRSADGETPEDAVARQAHAREVAARAGAPRPPTAVAEPPEDPHLAHERQRRANASIDDLAMDVRAMFVGERHLASRERGLPRGLAWRDGAPGETWQDRWELAQADTAWEDEERVLSARARWDWRRGTAALLYLGVVRPSWGWLMAPRRMQMLDRILDHSQPRWATLLRSALARTDVTDFVERQALTSIGYLSIRTGKGVAALTVEDLIAAQRAMGEEGQKRRTSLPSLHRPYLLLREVGVLPPESPVSLAAAQRAGQLTPDQLVGRYNVRNEGMAQLFTLYLTEREPSCDYSTLQTLAVKIVGTFWRGIEALWPEADSLRIPDSVMREWRRQLKHEPSERTGRLRRGHDAVLTTVRAFYLDINDWAQDEPETWAHFACPSPISRRETSSNGRTDARRRKSRMDHRTRTLAPLLPRLREATFDRLGSVQALHEAAASATLGTAFSHDGQQWVRVAPSRHSHNVRVLGNDGRRRNLTHEEDDAFWQWAIVEGLSILGPRIEELLELTAFDIVPWRRGNGQTVMLLRINPSKVDRERLLPLTRDQASIFATITRRVRDKHGTIPYVSRYDPNERQDGPELPHLFQRRFNGQRRVISYPTVINLLNRAVEAAGAGSNDPAIKFRPHDFRRMFVTEHVDAGLPIHVVAALVGHSSLDTTRTYAAIYPKTVIEAFLSHLAAKRERRPESEYRLDEEAAAKHRRDFERHFGQRQVQGGMCIRGYGEPCTRQHNCPRCPLIDLAVDAQPDLEAQSRDIRARLDEARRNGWSAAVEGFTLDLQAIEMKFAALERREHRALLPRADGLLDGTGFE